VKFEVLIAILKVSFFWMTLLFNLCLPVFQMKETTDSWNVSVYLPISMVSFARR